MRVPSTSGNVSLFNFSYSGAYVVGLSSRMVGRPLMPSPVSFPINRVSVSEVRCNLIETRRTMDERGRNLKLGLFR